MFAGALPGDWRKHGESRVERPAGHILYGDQAWHRSDHSHIPGEEPQRLRMRGDIGVSCFGAIIVHAYLKRDAEFMGDRFNVKICYPL